MMTAMVKRVCAVIVAVIVIGSCGVLGSLDWVEVVQLPACRRFDVTVYIDCDKPWFFNRPNDSQFKKLCNYCQIGIEKYWSRNIVHEGSIWRVNVKTVLRSRGDRKKIELQWGDSLGRSHNSDILKMTVKYAASESNAASLFTETCAHEIGHSFLRDAHGINFSWGHKGTSEIYGSFKSNTPYYPSSGEIDLMKYYRGRTSNFYSRVVAAESDVKDLVFKVRNSFITRNIRGC